MKELINNSERLRQKQSAFIKAVERNDFKKVEKLLADGVDKDLDECYPIKVAASKGYKEMVALLIYEGATINADNGYALRKATENAHKEVVKLLIDAGADVSVMGYHALRFAAERAKRRVYKEIVEMLILAAAEEIKRRNDN